MDKNRVQRIGFTQTEKSIHRILDICFTGLVFDGNQRTNTVLTAKVFRHPAHKEVGAGGIIVTALPHAYQAIVQFIIPVNITSPYVNKNGIAAGIQSYRTAVERLYVHASA